MADEECAINKIEDTFYCHHNNEIVEDEEEIVTEIHHFDDENTGTEVSISQIVELETPLESASSHNGLSSDQVKPKRLSDEFSNDDDDDDIEETEEVKESQDLDENSSNYEKTETSSCISLCFNGSNNLFVQSIDDAIERADFEQEQKLTGGIIIRTASLNNGDNEERLNFDVIRNEATSSAASVPESTSRRNELTSTPTSSRNAENNLRCNKSTISQIRSSSAKQKLSDKYVLSSLTDYDNNNSSNNAAGESSSRSSINHLNSSSSNSDSKIVEASSSSDHSHSSGRVKINLFDEEPSTSASTGHHHHHHHPRQHRRHNSKEEEEIDCLKLNDDYMDSANHDLSDDLDPEDTWADCEEGSDIEEICTCRNDSDDEYGASSSSSEDELPSRDVDLSSYTQLDPISDDILEACDGTPKIQRKRKLTEQSMLHVTAESPITTNRKRLALDTVSNNLLSPVTSAVTPKGLQRTPRLIPTKDNPPPELMDWLLTFQRWTNAERLVAVDKLIEQCEPSQVRYMMKVIEPQFQRDFISLLPKELALHVLAYLDPKDLLRAAQTCRSWRFLADDNLLWKDKCKGAGIISESHPEKPKRGRTGNMPKIASPWKAAYMRHHTIEMNWRTNPIRTPKVLNGHDDHVITCLQFGGNRIVSGSDDNTLKVWSAVTGKCLRTLVGHTGGVWSSQMSGNLIISGSTDRTLKIWDSETGSCKHTLYGHTSTVRCMHLHGNK
jgi:F-box/WD-40 domain protein 7